MHITDTLHPRHCYVAATRDAAATHDAAATVNSNVKAARAFYGIPDFILPPERDEIGRRYVVIKGVNPGIYTTRSDYQKQLFRVRGAEGKRFSYPMEAWRFYESKRLDGQVQYLAPKLMVPPASWAIVPITNPWPGLAEAFVVFRGTKPGPYKKWEECRQAIINCPNPRYTGAGTYSEAVFAHAKASLNGKVEKVT